MWTTMLLSYMHCRVQPFCNPPSEVCDVLLLVAPSSPLYLIGPFPHSMYFLTFSPVFYLTAILNVGCIG